MQKQSKSVKSVSQGSMTLFLALILTLVLSFLFSLLEAARVKSFQIIAKRDILLRLESEFGAYHIPLWENYQILFREGSVREDGLDLTLLEGRMVRESSSEQKGSSFYHLALRNVEIGGYELATDQGGASVEEQACKAIKGQIAADAAEIVREKLKEGKELAEEEENMKNKWDSAKNAVKEAGEMGKEIEKGEGEEKEGSQEEASKESSPERKEQLPENPMTWVDMWKKSPVLTLTVENPSEISGKGISLQSCCSKRKKEVGNRKWADRKKADKLWFVQYLNRYFSCQAGAGKENGSSHALDYELEYCIGGKGTDRENLEKTVKKLLILREAGNFAAIMQDGVKQAQALELAAAIVGFTGLPPVIQAVQTGILLAWSYIESILDVRCLLAGGKVPLIKNTAEWKSDISLGQKVLGQKTEKTEDENGMDYREYLQILLLTVQEKTLVSRAVDVMEQNIRMLPGEENFRMDTMVYGVQANGIYGAEPLFLSFVRIANTKKGTYHFISEGQISY